MMSKDVRRIRIIPLFVTVLLLLISLLSAAEEHTLKPVKFAVKTADLVEKADENDGEDKDVSLLLVQNKYIPYIQSIPICIPVLLHGAFWILFFTAYPHSRSVRSIFFWNPYARRILGLGYAGLLLTHVPFLRRRLLAPFSPLFIANAALNRFSVEEYYKESQVLNRKSDKIERLVDSLKPLSGQVVLEGTSGLGKSMFLRYLLFTSDRIAVFLPASKCTEGVIPAILSMIEMPAENEAFLKSIIHCGNIDIYIDSLDEVSPDIRARIMRFAETSTGIILATQPIDLQAPVNVRVMVMQPFSREQIEAFLHLCWERVKKRTTLSEDEYKTKCTEYLDKTFRKEGGPEQSILSNPMDLSIVAQNLASGIYPDLMSLFQQYYDIMVADYENMYSDNFTLLRFSMHVYKMRCNNLEKIEENGFDSILEYLDKYKMVTKREENSKDVWSFRHEKIMDLFAAQQFLGLDNYKQEEHMGDIRFKGVYRLLADLMPLEDAESLGVQLIEYAEKTGNRTISDAFVLALEKRIRYYSIGSEESDLGEEAKKIILDSLAHKVSHSYGEIEKFLYALWESVKEQSTVSEEEYKTNCTEYLDGALGSARKTELRYATQIILSNPMNLTVASQMLASGICPDLNSLCRQIQQQHGSEFQV